MSNRQRVTYEFGPFQLDVAERRLLRDGQPVSLPPKVFETLLALVENSGRLVEKNELISRLWPDTFVEDGTLARNISDLRRILVELTGEVRYIETVPKAGYRFVAPVTRVSNEDATLIIQRRTRSRVVLEEEVSANALITYRSVLTYHPITSPSSTPESEIRIWRLYGSNARTKSTRLICSL